MRTLQALLPLSVLAVVSGQGNFGGQGPSFNGQGPPSSGQGAPSSGQGPSSSGQNPRPGGKNGIAKVFETLNKDPCFKRLQDQFRTTDTTKHGLACASPLVNVIGRLTEHESRIIVVRCLAYKIGLSSKTGIVDKSEMKKFIGKANGASAEEKRQYQLAVDRPECYRVETCFEAFCSRSGVQLG